MVLAGLVGPVDVGVVRSSERSSSSLPVISSGSMISRHPSPNAFCTVGPTQESRMSTRDDSGERVVS